MKVESPDAVALLYDELPMEAKVEIVTEGGWASRAERTFSSRRHGGSSGTGADVPSAAKPMAPPSPRPNCPRR